VPFEVRNEHAVVVGIGDEQPAASLVGEHFAGKRQRRHAESVSFERRRERSADDQPLFVEHADDRLNRPIESLALALSGRRRNDIALGIDEDLGGPCASAVRLPDREIRVVHDRVVDVVANQNPSDVCRTCARW
jgi:hypothetical protein